MSTRICQGFEPWLNLSRTTASFSFGATPPSVETSVLQQDFHVEVEDARKSDSCNDPNIEKAVKERCFGGWSFLQALANSTQNGPSEDSDKIYVHPLAKRSASALSEQSLEMCTERLGSESGSIISENGDDLISSFSTSEELEKPSRMPCYNVKKRSTNKGNFPPPLTTIRKGSSGGVQVKSVREDGRLVIEAVSVRTPLSCFKAERKDGRLTLQLLHNSELCNENNPELAQGDDQDYDELDNTDGNYEDDDEDYVGHDPNESDSSIQNSGYGDEVHHHDKDIVSCSVNAREEMELGHYWRLRSCMEEGSHRRQGMPKWEPFWVTTS